MPDMSLHDLSPEDGEAWSGALAECCLDTLPPYSSQDKHQCPECGQPFIWVEDEAEGGWWEAQPHQPSPPTYEQLEAAAREVREILDEALAYVPDSFIEKWDLSRPANYVDVPCRACGALFESMTALQAHLVNSVSLAREVFNPETKQFERNPHYVGSGALGENLADGHVGQPGGLSDGAQ